MEAILNGWTGVVVLFRSISDRCDGRILEDDQNLGDAGWFWIILRNRTSDSEKAQGKQELAFWRHGARSN